MLTQQKDGAVRLRLILKIELTMTKV